MTEINLVIQTAFQKTLAQIKRVPKKFRTDSTPEFLCWWLKMLYRSWEMVSSLPQSEKNCLGFEYLHIPRRRFMNLIERRRSHVLVKVLSELKFAKGCRHFTCCTLRSWNARTSVVHAYWNYRGLTCGYALEGSTRVKENSSVIEKNSIKMFRNCWHSS